MQVVFLAPLGGLLSICPLIHSYNKCVEMQFGKEVKSWTGIMAQMMEALPGKHEAVGSVPSTAKH
jgi:hypothetical protein